MKKDRETEEHFRILQPGSILIEYGPVSMVVSAKRHDAGDTGLCIEAFRVVKECLKELGRQLPQLYRYPGECRSASFSGIAGIMAESSLRTGNPLLTPMAAVAGSMADAVADFLFEQGAQKATANNGGDIAVRLRKGESLKVGVYYDLEKKGEPDCIIVLSESKRQSIGGIATSGLGGRSLTMGIASGVTVFSDRCAIADSVATHLANASFLDNPKVHRVRAGEIDPDSDIAELLVVTGVEPLCEEEKDAALWQVKKEAAVQFEKGNLYACIATVQNKTVVFDPNHVLQTERRKKA